MTAAWFLCGASVMCVAGVFVVLYTRGIGPDRVVRSSTDPFGAYLILALLLAGLICAMGGLLTFAEVSS